MEPLDDLIARLNTLMGDPNQRPLLLHWSDIELLRNLKAELKRTNERLAARQRALSVAISLLNESKK
jgi:Ser/Thr protein kinase RdoA (MazF antagonist)